MPESKMNLNAKTRALCCTHLNLKHNCHSFCVFSTFLILVGACALPFTVFRSHFFGVHSAFNAKCEKFSNFSGLSSSPHFQAHSFRITVVICLVFSHVVRVYTIFIMNIECVCVAYMPRPSASGRKRWNASMGTGTKQESNTI